MASSPTTGSTQDTLKAAERPGGRSEGDPQRVARLFEKLPPHAIEAEMCLLGSILLEPRVLGDVTFVISEGADFYKPTNGAIYDAMVALYDKHASLDIVQLNQQLIDQDILDAVGGQDYLVELASCVPTAANANHYARLVREKAMVRKLIEEAGEILKQAYDSREDASAILDKAEHRIFSIAERGAHGVRRAHRVH
jgi:replicative DNA helicase